MSNKIRNRAEVIADVSITLIESKDMLPDEADKAAPGIKVEMEENIPSEMWTENDDKNSGVSYTQTIERRVRKKIKIDRNWGMAPSEKADVHLLDYSIEDWIRENNPGMKNKNMYRIDVHSVEIKWK